VALRGAIVEVSHSRGTRFATVRRERQVKAFMDHLRLDPRGARRLAIITCLAIGLSVGAQAQTATPSPVTPTITTPAVTATPSDGAQPKPTTAAPSTPPAQAAPAEKTPGAQTPKAPDASTPDTKAPDTKAPDPLAPGGKPNNTEIERGNAPGVPDNATTENANVVARPVIKISGQSSYDDAFKSIKASITTLQAAMGKASLKAAGHPITVFSEPDDKGFKYLAEIPLVAKPTGTLDLGPGVEIADSPSGKAIKFQHRGAYEDIDSTYDVITAYLDAKGMQVDNPYIEEYLTDLTTADDPNLQVDIYVFVKP
jgi:effector-binding domain-containing protein